VSAGEEDDGVADDIRSSTKGAVVMNTTPIHPHDLERDEGGPGAPPHGPTGHHRKDTDMNTTAIEQHNASGCRGRARKALASLLVGLVGIIGVVGFESGAVNAQGMTPGGGWYDASITCSASGRTSNITPSTVRISISLGAQRGYTSQRVAYRYWTTDGRTSTWSGWYTANVASFPNVSTVFNQTFNVQPYGSYDMYVDVMWSDGQRWTESTRFRADKYQWGWYYPTLSSYCAT
jgi:hypothetical protein